MNGRIMQVAVAIMGALLAITLSLSTVRAATHEASPQSLAAELVAVFSPPNAMRENMRRSAVSSIDQGLAQDPNLPPAELAYPGLTVAMKAAGVAAVEPLIDEACRDLAVRQRDMLAQSFTVPELRELLAFYRSPAATQGAAAALETARKALDPAMKKSMQGKAGAGELTGKDIGNMTGPSATAKLPQSVEQAYLRFSTAPVARKLASITPAFEALIAQWVNDTAPKIQSVITVSMTAKAANYIASHQ